MSDETKIEPALSAEEWATSRIPGGVAAGEWITPEQAPGYIALLNDALPDDDPRKITREKIDKLREMVSYAAGAYTFSAESEELKADEAMLAPFLDALASYLPPETT